MSAFDMSGPQAVRQAMLEAAERACAQARARGEVRVARVFHHAIDQLLSHGNPGPLRAVRQLARVPVTIEEFVESPDFLARLTNVWPALMADLRRLNPDVLIGEEPVHEAYLGGATGIGKSTLARITLLYQVYLLSCFSNPQSLFGLEAQTRFVFPLQSITPSVTQRVLYEPLRAMFEDMPFAQRHLDWNRRRTAALELAGGIHVVPLVAGVEQVLGQAIPGAILDEVNFMRIVERSIRVAGPRGLGGRYDQAEELATELVQRRASRFLNPPISVGALIFCSSARYLGDFLDRRIEALEAGARGNRPANEAGALADQAGAGMNGGTGSTADRGNTAYAFWSRHKRYDVVPAERYSGERFRLLIGNERHRTRPLETGEVAPDDARIERVPVEHLEEFRRDPEAALRTILGIGSESLNPFIDRRETIEAAFDRGFDLGLEFWTEKSEVVLAREGWPNWIEEALPSDRQAPRFVHVDLSLSRDACGIAVVKFAGMQNEDRGADLVKAKPHFVVEEALAIRPSAQAEIVISEVKDFLAQLLERHRLNIVQINCDGYRAADFRQAFQSLRVRVAEVSVDDDPAPYEYLRDCLYEGRLALVDSLVLERELVELERDPETGRVDHPPRGSKDVSDAVAGALFAAMSSRAIRTGSGYFDRDGYRPEDLRPTPPRPRSRRRRGSASHA